MKHTESPTRQQRAEAVISPGSVPVVAMIGGGQLARMTHQAAIALGQSLRILADDVGDSAALVGADVWLGDYTDVDTVLEFAKGSTAVTFDHEHVPGPVLAALTQAGCAVYAPPAALRFAQDKLAMRAKVAELNLPNPRWRQAHSSAAAVEFGDAIGWPIVVKTGTGGYDGKGVWVGTEAESTAKLVDELLAAGNAVLVEERVELVGEIAAVVARSPFGQVAAWPVVETVQQDGICVEVIAPVQIIDEELALAAQHAAITLATELGVVGVLAVELFVTAGSAGKRLLVNELAMRPHNSGHWTIDGALTSQFEQHIRAVVDYPLGTTSMKAPYVVMANVLGSADESMSLDERIHHLFAKDPAVKVHMYGKQFRPGRKMGHVTVLGDDLESVRRRAADAAAWLGGEALPGWGADHHNAGAGGRHG